MNRAPGKMNRGSCRRKNKLTTNRHVKREPGIYFANSDGEVEDMDQVRRRSFKEDGYRAENRVNVRDGKLEIESPDDLGYEDYLKRNKDEQGVGIARSMAEIEFIAEKKAYVRNGKLEIDPRDDLGYKDYLKKNTDEQCRGIAGSLAEVSCYVQMKIITEKDAETILETGRKFMMEKRPNWHRLMLRNSIAIQDTLHAAAIIPGAK